MQTEKTPAHFLFPVQASKSPSDKKNRSLISSRIPLQKSPGKLTNGLDAAIAKPGDRGSRSPDGRNNVSVNRKFPQTAMSTIREAC